MTVAEFLNTIKQRSDYYQNSLVLKSNDEYGCIYKFLVHCRDFATREEIFVELDVEESELSLNEKTVVSFISVSPAK